MATVTENLDLPDGSTPSNASVEIVLVGSGSTQIVGYVGGATIVGSVRPTLDAEGAYTVELPANPDITPAGTRWQRTVSAGGRKEITYWSIPAAGTHSAFDVLSAPPDDVATAAFDALAARVASLEATAITIEGA